MPHHVHQVMRTRAQSEELDIHQLRHACNGNPMGQFYGSPRPSQAFGRNSFGHIGIVKEVARIVPVDEVETPDLTVHREHAQCQGETDIDIRSPVADPAPQRAGWHISFYSGDTFWTRSCSCQSHVCETHAVRESIEFLLLSAVRAAVRGPHRSPTGPSTRAGREASLRNRAELPHFSEPDKL